MSMKKAAFLAIVLLFAAVAAQSDCSTLTILTESLPDFAVGQPAHFDLEAIGGTAPYHFEVTAGELPAGMHLTGSGGFRGVPTTPIDTTVFVTVTDANGCTLTMAYAIRAV
jgi:hypothetical protein